MDVYFQKPSSNILDARTKSTKKCEEVYEMEEIIGEGTFSNVVRGVHNDNGKKCAIKIVDKLKCSTEKQKWRLRNEIALHRKCKHANITQFLEYYESDIDICLVMELCEGGELFNRIVEKGRYSEKEASRAIRQITQAVQFLHSMGIVHRDIKPENILYKTKDEDSEIKLADFGLAKELEPTAGGGRSMLKASLSGTPAYCAPERLSQDQESKAVDMWSIGCIMYFLLFGVPPFYSNKEDEEECDDEIFDSVLEAVVTFPEGKTISPLAKDILLRLLEKDPTKRMSADEVLMHPWIKSSQKQSDEILSISSKGRTKEERSLLKSSINKVIDIRAQQEETN